MKRLRKIDNLKIQHLSGIFRHIWWNYISKRYIFFFLHSLANYFVKIYFLNKYFFQLLLWNLKITTNWYNYFDPKWPLMTTKVRFLKSSEPRRGSSFGYTVYLLIISCKIRPIIILITWFLRGLKNLDWPKLHFFNQRLISFQMKSQLLIYRLFQNLRRRVHFCVGLILRKFRFVTKDLEINIILRYQPLVLNRSFVTKVLSANIIK